MSAPVVGIVMGSDSDWPTMRAAADALEEFDVPFEADVVSAHRMPEEMVAYGREAAGRGLRVLVAGAGGAAHLPGMLAALTPLPRDGLDPASAEWRLKRHFGVSTLDAFGTFSRAELAAAGSALIYVEKTQLDSRPVFNPPTREVSGQALAIDAATRSNLELTRTLSGERAGSLIAAIDCTLTPGGARLFAERLAGPLTDAAEIRSRAGWRKLFC